MKQKVLAALVVTLLVLSLVPAFLSTPVYASSTTISAYKDTYISEGLKDTNFGSQDVLIAGGQSLEPSTKRTLIEFALSSLPEGATILSAYLQLYYYDNTGTIGSPAGRTLYAQRMLRLTWQETGATWNKYYGGYGGSWEVTGCGGTTYDYTTSGRSSATIPVSFGWMNWDVTTQVQYAWSSYWHYIPIRISDSSENVNYGVWFHSEEYSDASLRPRLIVNYAAPAAPTVGTVGADTITYDSAMCDGEIIATTENATRRGFKYGLTQTDTWDEYDTGSFGSGAFSLNLTGLSLGTTYWFRAYATNPHGTGYGSWKSFTTLSGVPVMTTDSVYVYGYMSCWSAEMSGTIISIGLATVTRRGFEWGLNITDPNDKYETGSFGVGVYSLTDSIAGNYSYWFRAYAVNSYGTGYGIWKPFVPEIPGPPEEGGCEGGGGANVTGSGTIGDPYVIWTVDGLQQMKTALSAYWELGCNIDASNTTGWNGGLGFDPIGSPATEFKGSLDGNGYSISNLYINRPTETAVGLFGLAGATGDGAVCVNMTLDSPEVHGKGSGVGSFAGKLVGIATNVYVIDGDVYATPVAAHSCNQVGGFIGQIGSGSQVSFCGYEGTVTTSNGFKVGGFVGDFYGVNTDVWCCYSNVTLVSNAPSDRPDDIGGFVGYTYGGAGSTISRCLSLGTVYSAGYGPSYPPLYIGGFVGELGYPGYVTTISDCFSRVNVSTVGQAIGGFCGWAYSGTMDNSYSTGTATGVSSVGGFCGSGSSATDCFWDTQTSGWPTSSCGTGKNTTEMKYESTFTSAGWDFDTIWDISSGINDGYPFLRWAGSAPVDATQYSLTLSSTDGGDVTDPGEGDFDYAYGTIVDLVAEPDEGYRFALWVGDVSEVADVQDSTSTVTVNGDYTITAVFVLEGKLALVISSTDGGSVTDPGEGVFSYDYLDFVYLEAAASGGYSFFAWTGDVSAVVDVHNATTYIEMLEDYAIVTNFATSSKYALVISSTDGGSVIDPGEGLFEYDPSEVVDLTALPNPDYWFVEWTGDVGTIDDVNAAVTNITMNDNYSITAVFETDAEVEFTLNITSSEGGSVTVPGEGAFVYGPGSGVVLTAVADADYEFMGWTGHTGTIADVGDPTTTITVNGDYSITANFVPTETCSLMLSISSSEGGSVTEPGQDVFTFPCGSVIDLVAQSYTGWWFSEWTGDIGSIANPLSSITTISMYGDYSIVANFVEEEAPLVGAPNVTTLNATSITAISASLQGSLISLGNYTTAYVFFQYGLNASYGTNTPEQMRSSTGNFSRSINDLSANITYHFRAVARYGSYVYGEDGNFTTSAEGPVEPPGYEYQPCGDTYKYEAYETGDNETAVVYGANWFFETFTPVEAFKISSVRLKVFKVGTPGALTVSIRNVDGTGKPTGIDLTSATSLDTGTSVGWYEITLPTYRLELKEYAVVVRAVAGDAGNYIGWQDDGTGSYTGGAYGSSSDSGVSWSVDEDKDFMFQTFGSTVLCIMDVKVFSGYLETGDWLITISYLNEFPPYYGVATASDYFNLQLIANGDLVASVGVPLWGNMPGSIYMSKALADTLEWGSTYTVRMRGTFDPYPTSTWTLTPPDWRGTDLTRLDAWVFEVASVMSTYYGQSLTVYSNNVNKLNDAGSALFAGGIPMLAALRGHLFVSPELYAPYTETSYEETSRWQEYFGPKIAGDAAAAGDVLGFSGIQTAQVVFFGLWFGGSVIVGAVAGGAAFLVSIPFFIIGVTTDIVPKAFIAVIGGIFVLLLVWYFWLSRT